MNQLIQYGATARSIVSTNAKTGSHTTRLLRAKEFKEEYKATHENASNREIKRAFEEYYLSASKASVGALAAKMTEGKLGVERYTVNADGDKLNVVFVDLTAVKSTSAVEEQIQTADKEALNRLLAMIQGKLAE